MGCIFLRYKIAHYPLDSELASLITFVLYARQLKPRLQPSHGLTKWGLDKFDPDNVRACILARDLAHLRTDVDFNALLADTEERFLRHKDELERYAFGRERLRRMKHNRPMRDDFDFKNADTNSISDSDFLEDSDEELTLVEKVEGIRLRERKRRRMLPAPS